MSGLVNSLGYNSVSMFCAFMVAFNFVPLAMPVYTTMKTTTRFILTVIFAFVLFSQFTQDYNPDMAILCPVAAFFGLLVAYFRFRAPKTRT